MIHISENYPLDTCLDWEIEENPIFDAYGNKIEGFKQIQNAKTGAVLQVAKTTYRPVPNNRLIEMANNFAENTAFEVQGFQSYGDGQKVMAYLKNTNPRNFGGQKAQDFLIIGNSHDGSTAFFTGFTNYIYRCQNMFSQTHQQNRIRHTTNSEQEIRAVEKTVDLYYNEITGVYEQAERMSEVKTEKETQNRFISHVLNLDEEQQFNELSGRRKNQIERIENAIFEETAALGHNLFGLFNGVTNYTSNIMKQKKAVFGNPFNTAALLNQRAFEFCNEELSSKGKNTMVNVNFQANPLIEDVTPIEVEDPAKSRPLTVSAVDPSDDF